MWCEHCNGDSQIETDNNGPIVDCPVCDGEGVERNTNHLPRQEKGQMGMEYIRKTYGVPAKRGGRVRFWGGGWRESFGRITSARNGKLRVLVDDRVPGYRGRVILHPTWNIEYLEQEKE
jgi:hypothetical protein